MDRWIDRHLYSRHCFSTFVQCSGEKRMQCKGIIILNRMVSVSDQEIFERVLKEVVGRTMQIIWGRSQCKGSEVAAYSFKKELGQKEWSIVKKRTVEHELRLMGCASVIQDLTGNHKKKPNPFIPRKMGGFWWNSTGRLI